MKELPEALREALMKEGDFVPYAPAKALMLKHGQDIAAIYEKLLVDERRLARRYTIALFLIGLCSGFSTGVCLIKGLGL